MPELKTKVLPKRDEIDSKYKWKLEDIYASIDDWEKDFSKVKEYVSQIVGFKGTLNKDSNTLLECLKLSNKLMSINDSVFVYARMKKDENNADSTYQSLTDKASALMTEAYAAVSFIVPEIISIPEDKLNSFLEENKDLQLYRQFFHEILRQKEHVLSEKEEELLALSSEMAGSPREIFTMFNNADIRFPFIKDEDGEEVELTKADTLNSLKARTEESAKMLLRPFTTLTANSKTPLLLLLSVISRLLNSMPLPLSTAHPLRLL